MSCIQQIESLLSNEYLQESDEKEICDLVKQNLSVLSKVNITKISKQRLQELTKEILKTPFNINYKKDLLLCFNNTFYNCDPMLILNEIKNNLMTAPSWMCHHVLCCYVIEQIYKNVYGYSEIKVLYDACNTKDHLIYCLLVFRSIMNDEFIHINSYYNLSSYYIENNYEQFISNLKSGIHFKNEKNDIVLHPESTKILNYLLRNILCNYSSDDAVKFALLNDFSKNYPYFNSVLYSMEFSMQQIMHLTKKIILNQNAINHFKKIILQNLSFNPKYCGCTNVVEKIVNFEGIIGRKFIFAGSDNSNINYKLIKNKKIICNTFHYQPVFSNKGIVDVDIHLKILMESPCNTLSFLNSFIFKNKDYKIYLLKHYGYNVANDKVIVDGKITSEPYKFNTMLSQNLNNQTYTIEITGNKCESKTYIINIEHITFVNYKMIDTFVVKEKDKCLFNWEHLKIFTSYEDINYVNNINKIIQSLHNNPENVDFKMLNAILIPNFIYSSNIPYTESNKVNIIYITKEFLKAISNTSEMINKIMIMECIFNYLMCHPDFISAHDKFIVTLILKQLEFLDDSNITNINDCIYVKIMFNFLYKKFFNPLKSKDTPKIEVTAEILKIIHDNYEKNKFDDVTEKVYNYITNETNNIKLNTLQWIYNYQPTTTKDISLKLSNITKYTYFYKQLMCLIYIDAKNMNPKIYQPGLTYNKSSLNYLIEGYDKMTNQDKLKKCKIMHNNLQTINSKLFNLHPEYSDNIENIGNAMKKKSEMIKWIDTIDNIINHQNVLTLNPLDELVLEFDAN
jgi:hypothetical protein